MRQLQRCRACRGAGHHKASGPAPCLTCAGTGKESFSRGALTVAVACATCHGDGLSRGPRCTDCNGSGLIGQRQTLVVQVPAGVADGQELRVAGAGHLGPRGGPAGDMVVTVKVQEDPRFRRDGPHLTATVQVSVSEAVLGARVPFTALDGSIARLRVPPGTRNGDRLRLRGGGLEMANGRRGDLIAVVEIWLPDVADQDARRLIREFGERTGTPRRDRNRHVTVQR